MKKIILLTLILLGILTPYVITILFLRTTSLFILTPIDLLSLIILVVSSIWYIRVERSIFIKHLVGWCSLGAVILYIVGYGYVLNACDYVFFKQREKRLDEFVIAIRSYNKIYEMTGGQRAFKSVNNHSFEFDISNDDTTNKAYLLDVVLVSEHIDRNVYDNFRQRLIESNIISFKTLDNGTISFMIEGFLSNCTGIAYSETGIIPVGIGYGKVTHWERVADKWYVWYST